MTKNEPLDMKLYNEIKDRVWKMYDKPSAYRSGMLVKLYREAGGKYSGDKDKDDGLSRWYRERRVNRRGEVGYKQPSDIYRPTVKVNSKTPTTFQELTTAVIEKARSEKYLHNRVEKFKK